MTWMVALPAWRASIFTFTVSPGLASVLSRPSFSVSGVSALAESP